MFPVAADAAQAELGDGGSDRGVGRRAGDHPRVSAGDDALRMVIALHYGTVIYGNIGAADRLDFTVIGPGVNLVSRIEAVAKSLDLPLVVSDDFARVYGGTLRSLGLRGLDQPHELFAPQEEGSEQEREPTCPARICCWSCHRPHTPFMDDLIGG